ncbi:unnamed protein product [Heterosigma akashiwo]
MTADQGWNLSELIGLHYEKNFPRPFSAKKISTGGMDITSITIPLRVEVRTAGRIFEKPRGFLLRCNLDSSNNSGGWWVSHPRLPPPFGGKSFMQTQMIEAHMLY